MKLLTRPINSALGRKARKPCTIKVPDVMINLNQRDINYRQDIEREQSKTSILVRMPPVFHSVIVTSIGSFSCLICTKVKMTRNGKQKCEPQETSRINKIYYTKDKMTTKRNGNKYPLRRRKSKTATRSILEPLIRNNTSPS